MKAEAIRKVRSSRLFCSSFNKSILFTNVYIYIYICVCVCVCVCACVRACIYAKFGRCRIV